ncbi:MAG: ABC transporter permease, partial [Phycisphaerales bacterium]
MSAGAVMGGKSSGSGRLAAAQRFLERWGVAVAFVLLFAASTWMQGFDFLNLENFRTLLNSNAAVGILAVGMTFVIISGGIDLSVGSIVVLSAALGTTAMNHLIGGETAEGTAVLAAVAATLVAGLLAGAVNGSLVVFGRIAPFIATLGGLAAYRSMALAIAEAGEIRSASSTVFSKIGRGGIPLAVESTNETGEPVYRGLLNAAGKPLTVPY